MEEQRRKAMKQMALYNQLLKESDDIYRVNVVASCAD